MLIGMTEKSLIMVAWSWILMDIISKLRTYSFSSFESKAFGVGLCDQEFANLVLVPWLNDFSSPCFGENEEEKTDGVLIYTICHIIVMFIFDISSLGCLIMNFLVTFLDI